MQHRMGALGIVATGLVTFAVSAGCGSSNDTRTTAGPTDPADIPGGGASAGGDGSGSGDGSGNGNGDGDGSGGSDTDSPAAPTPETPRCPAYTEPLPTNASLAGLSFSRETAKEFLLGALALRYPVGKAIVEGGMTGGGLYGNCLDAFLTNKSSADAVLRFASTTVHECGHFYDLGQSKGASATYVIRPDLKFTCESGDTTSRGGKTFARSLIKQDAHSAKRRPCGGKGCDSYASTYLDGQSGAQGYNSVLEEAAQYVNSLATALAFQEQYSRTNASERDGILTFLWYIERYLAMARADYPEAYRLISEDECWRKATLTIWDRGWLYLDATADRSSLGLDDDAIEPLVKDPVLTAEIDALRKLECE